MEERNAGDDFLLEDLLAMMDEIEQQVARMSFWERHFGWRCKRLKLKCRGLRYKRKEK